MRDPFAGCVRLEAWAEFENLDVLRLHDVLEPFVINHPTAGRTMVSRRKLNIVQMKTAQARCHRLKVQPVMDKPKVLLNLCVPNVVPVTDGRIIEALEEKLSLIHI